MIVRNKRSQASQRIRYSTHSSALPDITQPCRHTGKDFKERNRLRSRKEVARVRFSVMVVMVMVTVMVRVRDWYIRHVHEESENYNQRVPVNHSSD
jgi:hypothetical protein